MYLLLLTGHFSRIFYTVTQCDNVSCGCCGFECLHRMWQQVLFHLWCPSSKTVLRGSLSCLLSPAASPTECSLFCQQPQQSSTFISPDFTENVTDGLGPQRRSPFLDLLSSQCMRQKHSEGFMRKLPGSGQPTRCLY